MPIQQTERTEISRDIEGHLLLFFSGSHSPCVKGEDVICLWTCFFTQNFAPNPLEPADEHTFSTALHAQAWGKGIKTNKQTKPD